VEELKPALREKETPNERKLKICADRRQRRGILDSCSKIADGGLLDG